MRDETTCEIKIGHAIEKLREIETETVDTVITSPPYWGLRDYQTDPVVFGGDREHNHEWDAPISWQRRSNDDGKSEKQASNEGANNRDKPITFETCDCGAWKGQLGLEQSPEHFVEHLVEIFEECRRILKPTGTLWVNLGDSYMSKGSHTSPEQYGLQKHRDEAGKFRPKTLPDGYKEKDLVGLPWLFAFAARKAGWYLRNDIVWAKSISGPHYRGGVSMPEPVQDRCTRSHEFFFHFSKSRRYYYDIPSYAEPMANDGEFDTTGGLLRNMRTVWHFNPQPFPGAHFAVYPKHLIEPIIRASSSHTCCGDCGVPWVRRQPENQFTPDCECHGTIEKQEVVIPGRATSEDNADHLQQKWGATMKGEYVNQNSKYDGREENGGGPVKQRIIENLTKDKVKTVKVYVSDLDLLEHPTQPSVIVDPFSGSGTTGIVALDNGRSYIGIELNPEYAELSERRLKQERTGLTVSKYRESAVELKEYW